MRVAVRMLVLACAFWGLSFPAIKALGMVQSQALPVADTWFFSTATMVARFSLGALAAAALLWWRRGTLSLRRREVAQGVGLGLFGGLGMLLQVDGLAHTEASTSAFLTQGTVFFIPVFKSVWHRQPPSVREAACCLMALAGIAVLANFDWRALRMGRGEAETLLAAMLFTGHILWLERPCYRGNDALRTSVVMFGLIAVLCAPLLWWTGPGVRDAMQTFAHPSAWLFLAILIGPCTLLAFLWMNHWQPHVSAVTAGLVYCFEPVFASLFALFLPSWFSVFGGIHYADEAWTRTLVIGGGLVLAANLLMQWPGGRGSASLLNEHGV